MAIKVYEENNISAIAEKIREKTGAETTYKTAEMPDGIDEVYEVGVEQGKKAEYDAFWDIYQGNGAREVYIRAFTGYGFNFDNFRPKYDIRPTVADYLFYAWENVLPNQQGSLIEKLKECGVVLDTSLCTTFGYMFAFSYFTELPTLDFSSWVSGTNVFRTLKYLVKIEKLIVHENVTYKEWFKNDVNLSDIVIEGVIGNDINFQDCPLSVDSMISIVTHLADYGLTDNPNYMTRTIYFNGDCWSRLNASATPPAGEYNTWQEYIVDWLGWNYA